MVEQVVWEHPGMYMPLLGKNRWLVTDETVEFEK
jgi:hypothetical protein